MMEQKSSSVCIAASHNDEHKLARLSGDDAMPLYATIIPSNTRKARLQQEQAAKQTQQSHQPVCGSKQQPNASSENQISNATDNGGDDNDYESTSGESDGDETIELWSHEIPVWIKGEQRYISGVTDQTTCLDLIEALLIDEGVIKSQANDSNNNGGGANLYPTRVNDYVIAERWRRVEQILDPRTKILKIWTAWGAEQPEVKFTLKRRSDSHHSAPHQSQSQAHTAGDRDSGRGSPTGSINSAIVRRRRHRASKSTFAWMTHGQTIHPKSQKNSIERLMKLILEQGEVIQQQLAKLRDRELEITNIEEERHKHREKEHGKNYLLETYLKGLGESSAEDKQELGAGNSDSGVHTEETAASPVVQHEDEISDTLLPLNDPNLSASFKSGSKKRRSKREHELLLEHQSTKEYSSAIKSEAKSDEAGTSGQSEPVDSGLAAQIDILEKLIVLNKHLQREEELCVRLSAKIKRYEADASGLSETQVKDSLSRVNEQLDTKTYEIAKMESEIKTSDEALTAKTDFLKKLYDELEEAEVEQRKSEVTGAASDGLVPESSAPVTVKADKLIDPNSELAMSREYLAENIYNISKMILKSSAPMPMPMTSVPGQSTSNDFIRHTPDTASDMHLLNQQIYQMPNGCAEKRIIQAQIHTIPTNIQQPTQQSLASDLPLPMNPMNPQWDQYTHYNDAMRVSMNYLATINQRIQKSNHIETDKNNANNPIMQATQYKLGPKKLLINTQVINSNLSSVNENRSNIYKHNTILPPNDPGFAAFDLAGDDSQLGTLV